jgi:hypothetical protein
MGSILLLRFECLRLTAIFPRANKNVDDGASSFYYRVTFNLRAGNVGERPVNIPKARQNKVSIAKDL